MPESFNSSHINACVVGIGMLGPRFIVSSEARRTRAAQYVAPEGIRTRHLPHARQALYHYATAPLYIEIEMTISSMKTSVEFV